LYISGRGIYDFISKSYANRVGHVYGFVFSLAQPVLNIFNKIFFCILKKKLAKNKYATYNKIMLAFGFSHSIILYTWTNLVAQCQSLLTIARHFHFSIGLKQWIKFN
jgi:hypothetical protein